MDKSTNKREKYNQTVVKELAKSYGVGIDTVRKSLRGDRDSETSEKIRRDYKKATKALEQVNEALEQVTDAVLGNIINRK